tara:strand:+ start:11951 stop:12163 length:213 start_codon:yes stop_codon:yes gene_type:complete
MKTFNETKKIIIQKKENLNLSDFLDFVVRTPYVRSIFFDVIELSEFELFLYNKKIKEYNNELEVFLDHNF